MSQTPRRFRPYSTGDEASPDAETQRIERGDDQVAWQDMVNANNPDWRATRRRAGRTQTGSLNQQRISRWMAGGGWKFIAFGAVAMIVLLIIFLATRGPDPADVAIDPGTNGVASDLGVQPGSIDPNQPGGPVLLDQTPTTDGSEAPPAAAPPAQGSNLVVTGTGVEGLFLRDQPGGNILKTMPEGTVVEKLGEQQTADRVWFNIRDTSSGLEGWSASDFLQPAQ